MRRIGTDTNRRANPTGQGHRTGGAVAIYDVVQAPAHEVIVARWCREQGTALDPTGARAALHATMTSLATRYAAESDSIAAGVSSLMSGHIF